jgi:hypothetical protein
MKIRPVGTELFPADRRTDITKLVIVFGNFADTPKNLHSERNVCVLTRGRDMATGI